MLRFRLYPMYLYGCGIRIRFRNTDLFSEYGSVFGIRIRFRNTDSFSEYGFFFRIRIRFRNTDPFSEYPVFGIRIRFRNTDPFSKCGSVSEYGSGSIKLMNTDQIWVRIHNTAVKDFFCTNSCRIPTPSNTKVEKRSVFGITRPDEFCGSGRTTLITQS